MEVLAAAGVRSMSDKAVLAALNLKESQLHSMRQTYNPDEITSLVEEHNLHMDSMRDPLLAKL